VFNAAGKRAAGTRRTCALSWMRCCISRRRAAISGPTCRSHSARRGCGRSGAGGHEPAPGPTPSRCYSRPHARPRAERMGLRRWSSSTHAWHGVPRTEVPRSANGAVRSAAGGAPNVWWPDATGLPVGALVVSASAHENVASELRRSGSSCSTAGSPPRQRQEPAGATAWRSVGSAGKTSIRRSVPSVTSGGSKWRMAVWGGAAASRSRSRTPPRQRRLAPGPRRGNRAAASRPSSDLATAAALGCVGEPAPVPLVQFSSPSLLDCGARGRVCRLRKHVSRRRNCGLFLRADQLVQVGIGIGSWSKVQSSIMSRAMTSRHASRTAARRGPDPIVEGTRCQRIGGQDRSADSAKPTSSG